MIEERVGRGGKATGPGGVGWKRCAGIKKNGEPCLAFVPPGRELCMAHERKVKYETRRALASSRVSGPLSPEEKAEFQELLDNLTKQVRPKGPADSIAVHRLSMAIVRADRLDAQARGGDAGAIRALYFCDLTIQNWLVKLGVDRRLRVKREDEEYRRVKAMGRASNLWRDKDGKGPQPLNLERPDVDPDGNEVEVGIPRVVEKEPEEPPEPGAAPARKTSKPDPDRRPRPSAPAPAPAPERAPAPISTGRPMGRIRETRP